MKKMNFFIEPKSNNYNISFSESEKDGITYVKMTLDFAEPTNPEEFSVCWNVHNNNTYSLWSPLIGSERHLYTNTGRRADSSLSCGMPLVCMITKKGRLGYSFALSDCLTPTALSTNIREDDGMTACRIRFFTSSTTAITHYETIIRLDSRDLFYADAINDVRLWWENECGYKPAYVPDAAFDVVDSLWYSFHQELHTEEILKECRLSAEMGMKTVIIDDGWQTDNTEGGFDYCGDWEVAESKIPDIRYLTDEIHKLGMKVMLWFTIPFVGKYTKAYEKLRDYFVDSDKPHHTTFTFDPRYPIVRDYLTEIYVRAVKDWGMDGLKLDFIDYFMLTPHALEPDPRRDIEDLETAIDVLMMQVHDELIKVNPDVLIEFRQAYVGPAIRKYGNMLRVRDCPCDAMVNRRHTIDLRLTSGNTAVHSDMIMWDYTDTVETAALEMIATFYSVPQISVKIWEIPEEHRKMLRYLIGVQKKYADVLLHGDLVAYSPEIGYSLVCASKGEREFITAYVNTPVKLSKSESVVVNSALDDEIVAVINEPRKYRVVNCMGEELSCGEFGKGTHLIKVPVSGIIYFN